MTDSDDTRNLQTDYNFSRDTLLDLIEKGRESLDELINVARESEHPRAYEVLSGMIKNVSDINDKLMDLNKKNIEIQSTEESPSGALVPDKSANNTTNVFVGSTAALQKLLKEAAKTAETIEVQAEEVNIEEWKD